MNSVPTWQSVSQLPNFLQPRENPSATWQSDPSFPTVRRGCHSNTKIITTVTKILLWSSMSSCRLFSRACGQLAGLCPTCLFHSLRHGCLGLIEVFPFLSFFYSPRSITIVLYFSHQGLSFWSLRVFL